MQYHRPQCKAAHLRCCACSTAMLPKAANAALNANDTVARLYDALLALTIIVPTMCALRTTYSIGSTVYEWRVTAPLWL
jgi:hypothetical protein